MELLEQYIREKGVVKKGNVLKVDSFLNHQMDVHLFSEMGREWKRLFADAPINKSQIKGVLVCSIAGLGAVVRILKQPVSVFLILAAVVVLMELSFRKEKNKDSETLDAIKMEIEMLKQQNDT